MTHRISNIKWFAASLSVIVSLVVFIALYFVYQKTAERIFISGFFPADTRLAISAIDADGRTQLIEHVDIEGKGPLVKQYAVNQPLRGIYLEFNKRVPAKPSQQTKQRISIHNIQVPMPYSTDVFVGADQIPKKFASAQLVAGKTDLFHYDETHRIQLKSTFELGRQNWWLTIGLSLLFGLSTWLIVINSNWRSIPAFNDMSLGNRISSSAEFNAINGLRGLAAILVLFSHSAPYFDSVEMGIAILFVISGFLLSKPFVLNPEKIFSFTAIERYLTKRLKRILPMYYLFIFISYVLTYQFDTAIKHFLFIQASNHLWPMTQIFTFYMLLPIILLLVCWCHKRHVLLPIGTLSVGIIAWIFWMPKADIYYNGEYSHPFHLHSFLIGVLASYLHYDILLNYRQSINKLLSNKYVISTIAALVTLLSIAWSAPIDPPAIIAPWIAQFYIKSIMAALIIILVLNSLGNWFYYIISNWLFRSVGVIGFSFYLLHGLGISIVSKVQENVLNIVEPGMRSWTLTLASFIVTYILAIMAYSYVERPFFGYRRRETNGQV